MTHHELVLEMHRRIDKDQLRQAHESFTGTTWGKFFDVDAFVHLAAGHATRLNESLRPGCRCLDLGCGFGYVALALECLGHTCVAWDTETPVLRAVGPAIPVSKRVYLPILRGGTNITSDRLFDLIIMHGVVPMRDDAGWWLWSDYEMMAQALVCLLRSGGIMEWIVNNGDQVPVACDPSNWQMFAVLHEVLHTVNENIITIRTPSCAVC